MTKNVDPLPDRFDLPPSRDEALTLALDAIEAGKGDARDEALLWLDVALNDALVMLAERMGTDGPSRPCPRCNGTGRLPLVTSWDCEGCGKAINPLNPHWPGKEPGRVRHVEGSPACE